MLFFFAVSVMYIDFGNQSISTGALNCHFIRFFFYQPEINFSGRYCFGLEGIVFMFVGALSLERLSGSQPNFHTRWRGGLVQTLLEMGIVSLIVWQPSWKSTFCTQLWVT